MALVMAAVVRGVVRRITASDRASAWIVGEKPERPVDVPRMAGQLAFWIAVVFVFVGFFQALNLTLVTEPPNALLARLAEFFPRVLGASVLLAIAWVVASLMRRVVRTVLDRTRFHEKIRGVDQVDTEGRPVAQALADAVYWIILFLFLPAVLGALAVEGLLEPAQQISDQVLGFLPNLLGGALILGVGWVAARLIRDIVTNLLVAIGADALGERIGISVQAERGGLSRLVGIILYVLTLIPVVVAALNALDIASVTAPASSMLEQILAAILVLAASMALEQLGVGQVIIMIAFAAVVASAAVAATIAFGIGGRDYARHTIQRMTSKHGGGTDPSASTWATFSRGTEASPGGSPGIRGAAPSPPIPSTSSPDHRAPSFPREPSREPPRRSTTQAPRRYR